jgi:hypothetical protein
MTDEKQKGFPFAKVVIVMAVSFLVGLGLCGLDIALGANGIGKTGEEFNVGPLDGISLLVMALSAAGLMLSLVLWALAAIVGGIASSGSDTGAEKPPDDDQPSRNDND